MTPDNLEQLNYTPRRCCYLERELGETMRQHRRCLLVERSETNRCFIPMAYVIYLASVATLGMQRR
jgi:hypothetical protein